MRLDCAQRSGLHTHRITRMDVGFSLRETATARQWLHQQLDQFDVVASDRARLVLAASELVANAVEHAAPPAWLAVRLCNESVLLEVRDGSPERPLPRRSVPSNPRGRGLLLVERAMTGWGVHQGRDGKVVWCALDLDRTTTKEAR
ncbi:ATP-binding protein [Promicromonospora sp. NPDC023987]|uniref:ATP-binding protein n=1 Tax=Promicromonospora sp. NPDC023987 TaxID=3155360 RepID=UPI0033C16069